MSDKKRHRTIHEILQYLKGETSGMERHSLEREMEGDPFLQEAMEGFEKISPGSVEEDLVTLQQRLRRRKSRRRRITWYSMAAAVASILIVGTIFLQLYDVNPTDSRDKEFLEEAVPGEVPEEVPAVQEKGRGQSQPAEQKIETQPGPAPTAEASEPQPDAEQGPVDAEPAEKGPGQQSVPDNGPAIQAAAKKNSDQQPTDHIELADQAVEEPTPSAQPATDTDGMRARRVNRRMEKGAPPAPEQQAMETGQVEIVAVEAEAVTRAEAKGQVLPFPDEISGTIVSAEDRSPLAGASLSVNGVEAISISDMEGRFSIPVTQDSQTMVSARFPGMEAREMRIPANEEVTIILQPATIHDSDKSLYEAKEISDQQDKRQNELLPHSPEPSGGYISFYKYIKEHRRVPSNENEGTGGVVVLKFTISNLGEIRDIVPVRSPGASFTEEAIRLLKEGPPWIPAFSETGNIDQEVTLRIELD